VVLQEDLGDLLLQRAWRLAGAAERLRLLDGCRRILGQLAVVPPALAAARLDAARRKWEMDFFIRHFLPRFPVPAIHRERLRTGLHRLAEAAGAEETFAHRDFHSRNLLLFKGELAMVDFQDSLLAPRYYDLVSLAFDSYLDLGSLRGRLFANLAAVGNDGELRQVRLTALQRNIKALGTFGFQMFERKHPVYARYIPRTLRHIRGHLQVLADPHFRVLAKYFDSVTHDMK
jgi:aminoglycoside/choline kinase family phosphotransferase